MSNMNPFTISQNLQMINCQQTLPNMVLMMNDKKQLCYNFKTEQIKKHFTKEEDEKLKYLVGIYGENNWQKVSQFMIGRKPRQCRERYIGYLMPSLGKSNSSFPR